MKKKRMRNCIVALAVFAGSAAHAAHYALVPSEETAARCQKLGYVGEFKIKPFSNSWKLVFASGADRVVRKTANGAFSSYVSCAMGCSGYMELRLNLSTKIFSYWNSIERRPEVCRGNVTVQ